MHGHYHSAYRARIREAWGEVTVVGLDRDTMSGSMCLLHCADGTATIEPVPIP